MPKLPAANLLPPKPPVNKPKSPSKYKEVVKKEEIKPPQQKIEPPPQPKIQPTIEHSHLKIFDPIQPPKFEIKPLLETQEIFQPQKSPMQELPKPEPPSQEILKQEPPTQELPKPEPIKEEIKIAPEKEIIQPKHDIIKPEIKETQDNSSKSMEFKDIVRNLSFPKIPINNAPKKEKKKLIVCVTNYTGTTATQEEVSFFSLNVFFVDVFFKDSEILY